MVSEVLSVKERTINTIYSSALNGFEHIKNIKQLLKTKIISTEFFNKLTLLAVC